MFSPQPSLWDRAQLRWVIRWLEYQKHGPTITDLVQRAILDNLRKPLAWRFPDFAPRTEREPMSELLFILVIILIVVLLLRVR